MVNQILSADALQHGKKVSFSKPTEAKAVLLHSCESAPAWEDRTFNTGTYVSFNDTNSSYIFKGVPVGEEQEYLFRIPERRLSLLIEQKRAPTLIPRAVASIPLPDVPPVPVEEPKPLPPPLQIIPAEPEPEPEPEPVAVFSQSAAYRAMKHEALAWRGWPQEPVSVSYWEEATSSFGTVTIATPHQYMELWRDGLLEHQRRKQQKPEHLPTLLQLGYIGG